MQHTKASGKAAAQTTEQTRAEGTFFKECGVD
jgi:hypothetical protein